MNNIEKKNRFDGSLHFGAKNFYTITGRGAKAKEGEKAAVFARFGDPATGLIRQKNAESRKCICGADDYRMLFLKYGFRHVVCNRCGFLYVNPVLKGGLLDAFYKDEENWFKVLQNPVQKQMDRLKFSYGLDVIEKHARKGKLLDIGCGNCGFLEIAARRGWDSSGIEFNRKGLNIAKKKGISVVNIDIRDAYFDDKRYDAITLWEVLEHITDPRSFLRRVYRLMRSGKYLLIVVPNRDSLLNRMLRERSNSFAGHAHVNFFNSRLLSDLLKEEGMETVHTETIISELGNIRNYLNYEDAYEGSAKEGPGFLTPAFIHNNLLGCKLLVLARKKK